MMKKFTIYFILVVCLTVFAQNPALKVQEYSLDNGFKVYLNEDPSAKKYLAQLWSESAATMILLMLPVLRIFGTHAV